MAIIGLTGTHGSGKGTIVALLKERGFIPLRCSDVIREECDRRKLAQTREHLILVSKEMTLHYGSDIVAKRLFAKMSKDKDYVVDGIRRTAEIDFFRKKQGFVLISVDAPRKLRYERILSRNESTDHLSFASFAALEDKELLNVDSNMQLKACMELSDYHLINDGSVSTLKEKIFAILETIS